MAPESCNLDKEEAEVLKPSSPTPHPPPAPPSPSHPPLFLNHSKTITPEKFEALISKPAEESPPPVRLVNRCSNCQKRVGLTGFRCRCGDLFCARHRYFNTHDCSYDYKAAGREEISKANPVIRAAKIIKI